jgi:beta-glucuronidase
MIQNIADRNRTSLNGRWRVIVDPYEAGYRTFHGKPWDMGWFSNLPVRPGLAEYDWDRADLLNVPGDWNSQSEWLFFYEGTVWYKRDFETHRRDGERLFLHFGAANYEAIVYLNGQAVGSHRGGFTPFAFEVTDAIVEGKNFLVAKVDNTRHASAVPMSSTDWWNYGGITREVNLLTLPETFIRDYQVRLSDDGTRVIGWVQLDGPQIADQQLEVRLPEVGGVASVATDSAGQALFEIEAEVERWAPGRARLYDVQITSPADRVRDRIGFRTVDVRGHEILVNGEPVFLRGISLHEEAPTRPGRSWGEEDARTSLGWALELGCNFVRLAHYPHDEATTRVADELGLLVWSEIPVYWHIDWENADTLDCAKDQLEELISRDRNRAAVILWSLSNESPATPPRLAFLQALVRHARELDPSRLLTAALMARPGDGTMTIDDPIGEHLDVMGCNEYLGWYYRKPEEVAGTQWTSSWDKPLIMSELGAGALQGVEGDEETLFSERHQARVYEEQIAMLKQIPFLAGLSPWILKDFRSPRRPLKDIQDYYNRKGLISERGFRKRAFSVLQSWYRELAGA